MKPYTPLLKKINEQLNVPQPVKSRIVLEIAADLEDAYCCFMDQGMDENTAMIRIHEQFDFSPESLNELAAVHTPLFRRWIDKAVMQFGSRIEKTSLVLAVLFIAVVSGQALFMTPFFHYAGHAAWPILGVGLLGMAAAVSKGYQIQIKKDHRIQQLRQGLESLVFLSISSIVLGLWHYFYGLLQAGKLKLFLDYKFIITLRTDYADEYNIVFRTAEWLIHSSSVMMLSMQVAMGLAIVWFFLESRVNQIEQAEYELLLLE